MTNFGTSPKRLIARDVLAWSALIFSSATPVGCEPVVLAEGIGFGPWIPRGDGHGVDAIDCLTDAGIYGEKF